MKIMSCHLMNNKHHCCDIMGIKGFESCGFRKIINYEVITLPPLHHPVLNKSKVMEALRVKENY